MEKKGSSNEDGGQFGAQKGAFKSQGWQFAMIQRALKGKEEQASNVPRLNAE